MISDKEALLEFLKMPLESSDAVFGKFATIRGAMIRGNGLEKFLFVKGERNDRILLVAHADTIWDENYKTAQTGSKIIIEDDGIIRNNNGGLGADDRAGCAIAWLLRETGHSILITNGEEEQCKGSHWLMDHQRDVADDINENHQFIVQLDRRNGTDYKCYSVGTDSFRQYVEQVTGYSEPDRRYATDIVALCREICGVNLSVGYHREHSDEEYLVLKEWQDSLDLCRRWLSAPGLPRFYLHEKFSQNV